MQLYELKEIVDYLIENHPELTDEWVAAEHDVIYLPAPKKKSKEFKQQLEDWGGCGIEDEESIYCFV